MKKYKCLVTGSNGFLGRNLVEHLLIKGHSVDTLDQTRSDLDHKYLKHFNLDICDYKTLKKKIKTSYDYIFHFAAISDIENSTQYPYLTFNTNISGTLNMLNIMLLSHSKNFIFSSSIYVNSNQGSFYRISKTACEEILFEYEKRFKINFKVFRYGSIFGKYSPEKNKINKIKSVYHNRKKAYIDGTGDEVRRYISVDSALKKTLDLSFNNSKNKFYEITGKKKTTLKSLTNKLNKKLGVERIKFTNKVNQDHYIFNPNNKEKILFKKVYCDNEDLEKYILKN